MKLGLAVLLLVTALVYSPVQTAGLVYEDANDTSWRAPWRGAAVELAPWVNMFAVGNGTGPMPRMLTNVTYRLQAWADATPREYHLGNVAIHLVNVALLWAVLTPIGPVTAVVASSAFALHPIQTETVAYIASRPNLLMTTGVLLTLWALRVPGWGGVLLVTLGGLGAVLAKETGIVILGLLPLWCWMRGTWARRWGVPLALWTLGGAYAATLILKTAPLYTPAAWHGPFWGLAVACAALGRLCALVVWPVGFSLDHDWELITPIVAIVGLLACTSAVGAAWIVRRAAPAVTCAVIWLMVAILPHLVMNQPTGLLEHYLYLPLIGVWMGLGRGVEWLWQNTAIPTIPDTCTNPAASGK